MNTRRVINMPITEAQYKASFKYKTNNTKVFTISFNYKTEKDLIEYIKNHNNVTEFIKNLVIKQYKKEKGEI